MNVTSRHSRFISVYEWTNSTSNETNRECSLKWPLLIVPIKLISLRLPHLYIDHLQKYIMYFIMLRNAGNVGKSCSRAMFSE